MVKHLGSEGNAILFEEQLKEKDFIFLKPLIKQHLKYPKLDAVSLEDLQFVTRFILSKNPLIELHSMCNPT